MKISTYGIYYQTPKGLPLFNLLSQFSRLVALPFAGIYVGLHGIEIVAYYVWDW